MNIQTNQNILKNNLNNQSIYLDNRNSLKLSGVTKIDSLNPSEFLIETTLGGLQIKGNELEMKSFDIDNGNLNIVGSIDSIIYFNKSTKKNNKGFIQKLFK